MKSAGPVLHLAQQPPEPLLLEAVLLALLEELQREALVRAEHATYAAAQKTLSETQIIVIKVEAM